MVEAIYKSDDIARAQSGAIRRPARRSRNWMVLSVFGVVALVFCAAFAGVVVLAVSLGRLILGIGA